MRAVCFPAVRSPGTSRFARSTVLAAALAVLPVSAACAASPSTKPVPTTTATAKATGAPAVSVTFDTPGSTPRPLKETVRAIPKATRELVMRVRAVTYPGIACGFTFRGARPASPVAIRVSGTARNGRFDSGPLAVSWAAGAEPEVNAGASSDARGGWSFSAEAHANRNGPGWVVSVGGVPLQKEEVGTPSSATCVVTAGRTAPFAPANGPVGYWAGFATA